MRQMPYVSIHRRCVIIVGMRASPSFSFLSPLSLLLRKSFHAASAIGERGRFAIDPLIDNEEIANGANAQGRGRQVATVAFKGTASPLPPCSRRRNGRGRNHCRFSASFLVVISKQRPLRMLSETTQRGRACFTIGQRPRQAESGNARRIRRRIESVLPARDIPLVRPSVRPTRTRAHKPKIGLMDAREEKWKRKRENRKKLSSVRTCESGRSQPLYMTVESLRLSLLAASSSAARQVGAAGRGGGEGRRGGRQERQERKQAGRKLNFSSRHA